VSLLKTDIEQLKKHGLTLENIRQQLKIFSEGIPFVKIVK
jgi:DNA-binding transcriptional MerR regulator